MTIDRVYGTSVARSLGSADHSVAFAVASAKSGSPDIAVQANECFASLEKTLSELGLTRSSILSATVYLSSLRLKPAFDNAWVTWVGEDRSVWPQRACVGVELASGTDVEIVVVASRH